MDIKGRVETFPDRETWEAKRVGEGAGIGASESSAVLGISPRSTATEVWLRKTGRAGRTRDTVPMRVGSVLEPVILDLYREETGADVVRFDQLSRCRSPQHPWLTATPDAIADADTDGDGGWLVEAKSVEIRSREQAAEWGQPGSDHVPGYYYVQVQHQMIVTGAARVDLAVLVGKSDFRTYTIRPSPDVVALIVAETGRFWRDHVLGGTPPDDPFATPSQLLRIYPACAGETEFDEEISEAVQQLASLRESVGSRDREKDRLTSMILHAMGNTQYGLTTTGRKVRRIVSKIPERTQTVRAHEQQRLIIY